MNTLPCGHKSSLDPGTEPSTGIMANGQVQIITAQLSSRAVLLLLVVVLLLILWKLLCALADLIPIDLLRGQVITHDQLGALTSLL